MRIIEKLPQHTHTGSRPLVSEIYDSGNIIPFSNESESLKNNNILSGAGDTTI